MTESSKYRVPEAAAEFVGRAIDEARGGPNGNKLLSIRETKDIVLEAFIRWQSENPPDPTSEQMDAIMNEVPWRDSGNGYIFRIVLAKWISRMYLASPEPEPAEAVKDLLISEVPSGTMIHYEELDRRIIEAYRRGVQSCTGGKP
jgi:hypothetical protein